MRIASVGHAVFAVVLVALGIIGWMHGNFAPIWDPVPKGVPAREVLVYLCAFISLATGIGLLWRRTAAFAARLLFAWSLLWLLVFRMPSILSEPLFGALWSVFPTAVLVAAAWVLYSWFATDWDRRHLGFGLGGAARRIARALYGLALVFFGLAHFIDLRDTVVLEPGWLPWHVFWAYFFGCAFIAAGVGVLIGVCARLAAALSTVEIGLFTLVVWVPIVAAGSKSAFQWSETVLSFALTACAWVVADSYRGTPWLAVGKP
ncbi:MAG: hypothetical protein WBD67_13565 [Terracidiphilus sp.]